SRQDACKRRLPNREPPVGTGTQSDFSGDGADRRGGRHAHGAIIPSSPCGRVAPSSGATSLSCAPPYTVFEPSGTRSPPLPRSAAPDRGFTTLATTRLKTVSSFG